MGKFIRVSLFTFGVCGLLVSRAFPEEVSCRLEKIVITPSRIPTPESQRYRSVATITGDDIETSSYTAVQDIIGGLGAIDLRRRAPEGVQADVTIRGSTFEQSQVLLDGIKMNDPQTGHHNMDIPITKFDLERIDILKGPGSSAYGANAFGGIIHFVTRKPEENKVVVESSGGSYDFFSGG
jgi:iron complex outermembrane receptor protein